MMANTRNCEETDWEKGMHKGADWAMQEVHGKVLTRIIQE
jgi:hypothetical protein